MWHGIVSKRPSPAMIVALIALFVSLTGNGLALSGKFTVDGNDLQRGAVHRYAIHKNAVNSARIDSGAIRGSDLGKVFRVETALPIPNANQNQTGVQCPSGSQVISGGAGSSTFGTPISGSRPELQNNGWSGWLRNDSGSEITLNVYAVCLK